MKILIACEFSGIVRTEFEKLGHDVMSCDLLPTDKLGKHYQGDIFDILYDGWDLMIAHPPCTYLSNSGVSWLWRDSNRWHDMVNGARFFKQLLNAPIPHIAVENPVMHKYAKQIVGVEQTQSIQPYEFGHGESKRTCLWLKNLPPLTPTKIMTECVQRLHYLPPSPDRWKLRSTTYQGIAEAMAIQWSEYLELDIRTNQLDLFSGVA